MIINENLFKKYFIYLNYNLIDFQKLINDHMIEIEKLTPLNKSTNLIIGEIIDFHKIPSAKKLSWVNVNIGSQIVNIICGASNLEKNKKVIVALPEAYLDTLKITIQAKKFYDIESQGMLCSVQELGLPITFFSEKEKEGILLWKDDEAILGNCALEYLSLKGSLLELSLTPDRADLLSYQGFIKDLKAIASEYDLPLKPLFSPLVKESNINNRFQIEIQDENCFEYHIRYIPNIKIDISPLWLRSLLMTHNITPINNVIDIMNLVLIECGIILDVFDAALLKKNKIIIRKAHDQEKITFPNQTSHLLTSEDLVIENDEKIIALAGITNSADNNISFQTQEIIITASYFKPLTLLKTSNKYNLHDEKILRHIRGIDPALILQGMEKAISLLQKYSQAQVAQGIISTKKNSKTNSLINVPLSLINKKSAISLTSAQIVEYLKNLDYKIKQTKVDTLLVQAPSRRYDVSVPEDVISDLIRLYGYNKIIINEKNILSIDKSAYTPKQKTLIKLKNLLSNLGFFEIITYSLISPKMFKLFTPYQNYIQVKKPISQDKIILRHCLIGSLIEVLSYNQKRDNYDNAFFEIGKVYYPQQEFLHLALGLSGNLVSSGWLKQDISSSFFVLKGILERIQTFLNISLQLQQTDTYSYLHLGKQAHIFWKEKKIGFIGELHPSLCRDYHLKPSFVLEIHLNNIFLNPNKQIYFQEISRFPHVVRDLSFWIAKKYSFHSIMQTVQDMQIAILTKYELVDIYFDTVRFPEEYSLSLRFTFNNIQQNLNKNEIKLLMQKIENQINKKYQIRIR